jgi:hypothetical protein
VSTPCSTPKTKAGNVIPLRCPPPAAGAGHLCKTSVSWHIDHAAASGPQREEPRAAARLGDFEPWTDAFRRLLDIDASLAGTALSFEVWKPLAANASCEDGLYSPE